MASKLEIKTMQEDRLYDFLLFSRMVKSGKVSELDKHLDAASEKALSGMSAAQIDAVKERVSRSFNALYGD